MARIGVTLRAWDEAGNAIGGSPTEIRVFDDFDCTAASVVTDDAAGGTTIGQPIIANSGWSTTLAVTTAAVDTTITVASTGTFAVGQRVPIYDGTNTDYRFIRAILAGPPRLTLNAAIGRIYSNANTSVGNLDQVGIWSGFLDDSVYHYIQTKDVGSTRVMPGTLIPVKVGASSVAVQEEAVAAGTRATVNFIGPSVTAVDNAGSARIDVTLTGLQADGAITTPSIGFASDPDNGLYRIGANDWAAVVGGHIAERFNDVASAVNYLLLTNSATGNKPILEPAGTDANVGLLIRAKGAAGVEFGKQYVAQRVAAGNSSTAITIDWNSGNVQSVTMTGNCTFTLSNPISGGRYVLLLTQDATGARTLTWPASVKWSGGSAPVGSAATKVDVISLIWDGTNYFGSFATNF